METLRTLGTLILFVATIGLLVGSALGDDKAQTPPAPAPVRMESKPLSKVGSMAADVLRQHVEAVNQDYQALQQEERDAQKLGPDWVLDLVNGRMVRQASIVIPPASPAPAKAPEPAKPSPVPSASKK